MSGRSKGFDPLSNLFDAPSPPVRPGDDANTAPEIDKVALAKKLAADARAKAEAEAAAAEKVALAKKLAAEAKAKAEAAAQADKLALAKKLAAEAKAKAEAQAAQKKDQADKAALAKALAKAAMAKAAQSKPAPKKKSLADRAPRSLADRASGGKRMSALEAARAAAAEEAARKQAKSDAKQAAAKAQQAAVQAQQVAVAKKAAATSGGLVQKVLGSDVVSQPARLATQRDLLKALWKAHVQRHVEDQNWAVVGGCAAVVDALGRLGAGQLAAIPAKAGDSELLVWVDLSRGAIVAVIPDGRTYLAGL